MNEAVIQRNDYVRQMLDAMRLPKLLKVIKELALYPGEAHIFWPPRHRESAMTRNLDWFDYWLLGRKDND